MGGQVVGSGGGKERGKAVGDVMGSGKGGR